MKGQATLKGVLFAGWLCIIIGFLYIYKQSGVSFTELPEYIRMWVESFGIWGPVIYIGLYAVRTLTLFSATVFTLASGLIFGPWLGMLYTLIGENLAANLAFFVGRYFGKDVIARAGKQVSFFPTGDKFREHGFMSVLMMRLLFFPFDWVGYLSGAYNMRQRDFALGTAIGILPGLIAFTFLGGALHDPLRALPLFVIFFVLGLIIARYIRGTDLGKELQGIKDGKEGYEK